MNGSAGRTASRGWAGIPALLVALAGTAATAAPESPAVARMMGSGVHAYFSGDFLRSYEDLSAAVEAGSRDPRVLYFRGLAAVRLGRFDEAEADFSRGADLEAAGAANWPVPQSLERVQGCDRLRLERHRARARVARLQGDVAAEAERYSGIMGRQEDVLRGKRPAPPAARDGAAGGNLFDDDAEPARPEPANGGDAETIPPPRVPQLEPEPEPEAPEPAPAGEPAMEDESEPAAGAEEEPAPASEPGAGTEPQPGIDPAPGTDPVSEPAPETEPAPGAGGSEPMAEGETVPADNANPEPAVEAPPAAGGLEIPEAAPGAEGGIAPEPNADPVEPMAEEGAPAAEGQ